MSIQAVLRSIFGTDGQMQSEIASDEEIQEIARKIDSIGEAADRIHPAASLEEALEQISVRRSHRG